tara:strand:- start:3943 stop:4644 length:702 start_codon:yes stop_codon:yes gene_type:complete
MKHPDFAKRFKEAVAAAGVSDTQDALAKLLGVSTVTIWSYRNGDKLPRMSTATRISKALGVSVDWLLTGEGTMRSGTATKPNVVELPTKKPNVVHIPRLDVMASMGLGVARVEQDDIVEEMAVSKDWLRRNVNATAPGNLALLDAKGDSMEGTFSDGDLLLVDRGISEVKVDAVYVLALDDELFIKRLQRRPDGTMLMLSDNPKYPPYELKNGDLSTFQVLGRVLLAWNARRL